MTQEHRTGRGTILDVAIDGPYQPGIEVQRSAIEPTLVPAAASFASTDSPSATGPDSLPGRTNEPVPGQYRELARSAARQPGENLLGLGHLRDEPEDCARLPEIITQDRG